MTSSGELKNRVMDADSLAKLIEQFEDTPAEKLAAAVVQNRWDRDVPLDRAKAVIQQERDRVDALDGISLTETSRAPRYMDLNDLELLSGYEFEHVLAEILRRVEGDATVTKLSGDQGVDLVWFREDSVVGIQAKAYNKDNPVGNSAVQEIYTGSTVHEADYSIDVSAVVTTSRYTKGAKAAAENSDVKLFDRSDLKSWLSEAELDAATMGEILENI